MRNKAMIDIGTNSARLLIYQLSDQGSVCRVNKFVRYTRMGQDVDRTKMLHPDAMQRNLEALAEFKSIAREVDADEITIFGTSAMRDARNTDEFIDLVRQTLGLDVQVIPGKLEADLGFSGVAQCYEKDILVFDIGGGSTELIWGCGDQIKGMHSINVGGVRSTEKHIRHDPPIAAETEAILKEAEVGVSAVLDKFVGLQYETLVGIGGTATTLATIKLALAEYDSEKVHRSRITLSDVREIRARLQAVPLAERQTIVGLDAKRADIIIAGTCILEAIMHCTGREYYEVCDYDNLEGAAKRLSTQPLFQASRY